MPKSASTPSCSAGHSRARRTLTTKPNKSHERCESLESILTTFTWGICCAWSTSIPRAEIVGIADEQRGRMDQAAASFGLGERRYLLTINRCLEQVKPDLVILCPAAARHAEWVEKVAPAGVPILVEKPFAGTLAEADRMIAAMEKSGQALAINWPLRWIASHVMAHRLIGEGQIGDVEAGALLRWEPGPAVARR